MKRIRAPLVVLGALVLWGSVPPDAPLADAAMEDDAARVVELLESGADVNAAQGDGMTALHWAAYNGRAELVETLLSAGANIDPVTRIGSYTPLHHAARNGYADVVDALLAAGANPEARTSTGGASPLHLAAAAGREAAVESLVRAGAEVDAREERWGQTPLIFAASAGRTSAVRTLMDLGADPSLTTNVVDIPEKEAVDRAAGEVRDQILETFREQAEDESSWRPDPSQVKAAVQAAQDVQKAGTVSGDTSERDTSDDAFVGYTGLVGTQGGLTALLHAVREGHAETAIALIEGGAEVNRRSAGDETPPLLMATINGHFDLALELLVRGADPNLASVAGATPLYTALNTQWAPKARYPQQQAYQQQEASYLDVMEALLEAGADPNVRLRQHLWYMSYTFDLLGVNVAGSTPFWRAAYATDAEAMRLLVEHGADPDIPTRKPPERRRGDEESEEEDPSGLPPVPVGGPAVWPIHAAAGVGYGQGFAGNAHRHVPDGWMPAMRYLVEDLGVDVNVRDHDGYNAVHHAAARGHDEMIRFLVEHGADVTAVSREGQTTADMANGPVQRISPFPSTIRLLESLGSENNDNCVSC
ncbi:MAG: ankyrin repeat domain-containing protein [Gemmatimonadota bacterium]|nr:ankyrin repeat domain-containing protein [Gemmatimonadota bacterium]